MATTAIAYGYNNLIPEIPQVATTGEESKESKIRTKLREVLIGLNLLEISTYHLIKNEEAKIMNLEKPIEVENSKTEYKILRPNLLIPALRILTENKDNEYPQKIFEIGTVFSKNNSCETKIKETENLLITSSPSNFTEIKQIINSFLETIGIKIELEETSLPWIIEGRAASIKLNNKNIGYIGELHPKILKEWGIKMPVSVTEISLEEIINILK